MFQLIQVKFLKILNDLDIVDKEKEEILDLILKLNKYIF
jgi:hypothetical protein